MILNNIELFLGSKIFFLQQHFTISMAF